MIRYAKTLAFMLLGMLFSIVANAGTDGEWKVFAAYSDVRQTAVAEHCVYVLASGGLYSYVPEDPNAPFSSAVGGSIRTYNRQNGLHNDGIKHIAWSAASHRLVVVYDDDFIDILNPDGTAVSVPDIFARHESSENFITHVLCHDGKAYLSTPGGVVILDVSNAVITGKAIFNFPIDYTMIADGKLIAVAKAVGMISCALSGNITNPYNWSYFSEYVEPDLSFGTPPVRPSGPAFNEFQHMAMANGCLYAVRGYVNYAEVIEENTPGDIQKYNPSTGEWSLLNTSFSASLGHIYTDHNCVLADPADETHLWVSGKTGLYEFRGDEFVAHWNYTNTGNAIQSYNDKSLNRNILMSMAYDQEGNLWLVNSFAKRSVVCYTKDKEWKSYPIAIFDEKRPVRDNQLISAKIHDNKLWFVCYHHTNNGLFCFDLATKKSHFYSLIFDNYDKYETVRNFMAIEFDSKGNLWLITEPSNYIIKAADLEHLPEGETIRATLIQPTDSSGFAKQFTHCTAFSIVRDSLGHMWVGTTENGVYVLNADGSRIIRHYTTANSPLPTNRITDIIIDAANETVYIGTHSGLAALRTELVKAMPSSVGSTVTASPNPVPAGYSGSIRIEGLAPQSEFTITTADGSEVLRATATGTYEWDGCDSTGESVASGVYNVCADGIILTKITITR